MKQNSRFRACLNGEFEDSWIEFEADEFVIEHNSLVFRDVKNNVTAIIPNNWVIISIPEE